jgi:hypothetical protein
MLPHRRLGVRALQLLDIGGDVDRFYLCRVAKGNSCGRRSVCD